MSISPGSHVGPYEVVAALGEGAMGVVFRARDSRLQRDVALKLLPEQFAQDPDRLSRFQREAQVLASLNHTNIAQIYGLEQVSGSTCIVMELVEGETLEERLKRGPLSYDETLDISRQLTEALAAAHEHGVVHRDLKPANIKLTPNGTVKILDFGLAKALGPKASDINMSAMPTVASGSIVGTVIGTPGYMSPEQARGKEVDSRTDIWAFGCVVYEMLTGRQAFGGETITDVMAKIVTSPPDLALLPQDTPRSMRLLLSSVLDKNASHRLQHIADSRLFLEGPLVVEESKPVAGPQHGLRGKLVPLALALALVAAAVPAVLYFRGNSQPARPMRFEISFPQMLGQPAISPDGRLIAYAAQPADGKRALWLRPIDSDAAQQLPGTEDVAGALWSPDSKKVAFTANGKLKKIDVSGGSPQLLADVTGGIRGADWNQSGVILLARNSDNVISRISDAGGEMTPVTKLDKEKEYLHGVPVFLPDGNHFLYVSLAIKPEDSGIFVTSLDASKPPTRVIALQPVQFNGMLYASGYLLILNNRKLTAQRLNARGDAVEGEPSLLAEDLDNGLSVSRNGLLMYRKLAPVALKQLQWFDRQGRQDGQAGAEANYGDVDLSPKGDRAAVDIYANDNRRDIWIIDLARAVPSRITFDGATDWSPAWAPDGQRVAYASARADKPRQVFEKSATGAGTESLLSPNDADGGVPVHWSPDGKYIVVSRPKQNANGNDTWLQPLFGDRKPILYLETSFDKFQARVSPDSRFMAYSTNESGMYQIVVQTFPDPNGGKWQITADGGMEPKWRHDGRELYYLALDGKLMAVSISGPAFQAGRPMMLFQTPLTVNRTQPNRDRRYDVSPDGRFLIVTPATSTAALPTTVVVNWAAALEK